jgi:hypothetical protein
MQHGFQRFLTALVVAALACFGLTAVSSSRPAAATPPGAGPGGPILVITNTADPFSSYLSEILLSEGLNEFDAVDLGSVTPAVLAAHTTVVLGATALSPARVTDLTNFVNAGGNLIAMRPDTGLASLLGIGPAAGSLSNAYLKVDTNTTAGKGITDQTIQFHGTADNYTLAGATSVATLYGNATTATANPAVTVRTVGVNGGQAAAFTYDLPQSVLLTRQGNPQWSGEDRDGVTPIRPNDLFYGNAAGDSQPDWIDFSKAAIPQADEQQRLLANLITTTNLDRAPLPRFWYLPRGLRAAVVSTGDDHATGGTAGRFGLEEGASTPGCSVAAWQCVRSTSYVYPGSPLTDTQAQAYQADGFEIALHVNTGCADWTPGALDTMYTDQLAQFASSYPSVHAPATNRTHCLAWSDYDTQPQVELSHGIRLDTSYYYYWPAGNVVDANPGFFTGSGFPQRFADANGNLIDVYQATTQMTDESGQTYPATVNTLLDRALGPLGYYGVFTVNAHTDSATSDVWSAVLNAAQSRGVPLVSAKQMLDWLDGRNASQFDNVAWNGTTLGFSIAADARAVDLQAMVPARAASGAHLTALSRNGSPVTFTTETRKGISYAVFPGAGGDYTATYTADTTPPTISNVKAAAHGGGTATVSWTTDEPSTTHVAYGTSPASLTSTADDSALVTAHSIDISGLTAGTTYSYRVASTDDANNTATAPNPPAAPATFVAPLIVDTDTTTADFAAGTAGACRTVAHSGDGEVLLGATDSSEFDSLPANWETDSFGGAVSFSNGQMVLNGARAKPTSLLPPVRSIEFVATFTADKFQHVGLADAFDAPPWATFSTGSDGASLKARTSDNNGTATDEAIPGNWFDAPHRYRIDLTGTQAIYSIDGTVVTTHAANFTQNLRPVASDAVTADPALSVDWLDETPYDASCTYQSHAVDAGSTVDWTTLSNDASLPTGTGVTLETRTSPDGTTWSPYAAVSGGTIASPDNRYLQYRATLTSSNDRVTPALKSVTVAANPPQETTPPTTTMLVPANNASIHGATFLDASAADNVGVTGVEFRLTGGTFHDAPIATATNTVYGWLGAWNTATVPQGTYTVRSRAVDAAGNEGFSAPITIHIDNTAPMATMVLPANNAALRGAQFVDAVASDNVGVTKVEFRVTGGALTNAVVSGGTSWIYGWLGGWNTDAYAAGTYSLRAYAYDAAGNVGISAPVQVVVDRTPPATAVTVPSANNATLSGNTIIDASASDNVAVSKVVFTLTGGTFNNTTIATAGSTLYGWLGIWNTASVPNGTYSLRSVATDTAGNTTTSAARTVKIQN